MARLFTPRYKQRMRVLAAMVNMGAGAAPFVVGLLVLQMLPEAPRWLPGAVACVCFVAGAMLPWVFQNTMGLAGNGSLRRRLKALLEAESGQALAGALFVGFSPGEELHVWQGETSRDVGFLEIQPGGLSYRGDEFSWGLPRDYIDHLDLTPPEGGMRRILVRWHVPREGGRTFSLEAREARTVSGARVATAALHRELRDWLRAPATESPAAPAGGAPPTDMTGGQIVEEPARGSCLVIMAATIITLVTIWRISGALLRDGLPYDAILWAGLISVTGAQATGYLLHYLQAWEAEHRRRPGRGRER